MKTLTLLRHAKSSWDDPALRDFDRPLSARGTRAAKAMGLHMRNDGMRFDRILASPAARVVGTLDDLSKSYGRALTPDWDQRVYLASAGALLDLVRETPADVDRLLLVGHNPGLEDLVLMLAPDRTDDPLRGGVEEKFPTASLAMLEFDTDQWADIASHSAVFRKFVRPRDLDAALGPDRE